VSPPPRALVIAHRGASGCELENTLAAFRAAARLGADAVELDVHGTADGVLVVHHDDALHGRPRRPIARSSLSDVRAHRLANGESIPTLEESLAAIGPTLQVFVEVKALLPEHDDILFATLDRGPNPAGYAVHSFDHAIVRRLAQRRPERSFGALSTKYLARPLEVLGAARAGTLWQERPVTDARLVQAVHEGGARIYVWTVNADSEMRRFLTMGVDGICTNYPDVARRVRDGRAA
jgi:glycerophosphoryl diester phosphodiesterase